MVIENGKESETVEFKESLSQLDKGLCALSAMLNKNGEGRVYFGVDDDGNITNKITIGKNSLNDIRNRIKDFIKPSFSYDLETIEDNGKVCIKLSGYGFDKPYSFDGRFYLRNASSNELLEPDTLKEIYNERKMDIIRKIPSDLQELTFKNLVLILSSNGMHASDRDGFYRSIGLYNSKHELNYMAFLLSDQNNLSIKVTTFAGMDKTKMIERKEFGRQCLLKTVLDVINYMSLLNKTKVYLSKGTREETNLFDFKSFREAWINACLHNDWSGMVPPSIFIFDDRIEIVSYGSLPYSLSLAKFYEGESKPINKALFNIFIMAHLAEQSGHGVPIIARNYGRDAFDFGDDIIKVTLKFSFTPDEVIARKSRESMDLTDYQKKVLEYLYMNPKAKIVDVSSTLGISVAGVKKIIQFLKENRFIERKGNKRESFWKRLY